MSYMVHEGETDLRFMFFSLKIVIQLTLPNFYDVNFVQLAEYLGHVYELQHVTYMFRNTHNIVAGFRSAMI